VEEARGHFRIGYALEFEIDGQWLRRTSGSADFLNQRWCDYTGISLEDACGSGWQTATHPDDAAAMHDYWRMLLESGQPGEVEVRT